MPKAKFEAADRLLLTAGEAADLLGVSLEAFRFEIAPDLRGVTVRSTWRYSRLSIEDWIARHAVAPSPPEVPAAPSTAHLPPAAPRPAARPMLFTAAEAAELLGVSRDVFREDVAPKLRGVPIRSTWRYSPQALAKWIDRTERYC